VKKQKQNKRVRMISAAQLKVKTTNQKQNTFKKWEGF